MQIVFMAERNMSVKQSERNEIPYDAIRDERKSTFFRYRVPTSTRASETEIGPNTAVLVIDVGFNVIPVSASRYDWQLWIHPNPPSKFSSVSIHSNLLYAMVSLLANTRGLIRKVPFGVDDCLSSNELLIISFIDNSSEGHFLRGRRVQSEQSISFSFFK